MNIFGIVILATLGGTFLIRLIANLLNLRAAGAELPAEFEGVYDQEAYGKSQRYLREATTLGLLSGFFDLAVLLVFWFSGAFNTVDLAVRGLGLPSIPTGIVYIGLLFVLQSLAGMPFDIYRIFVLEEKFGFNKTTPLTFIADKVKAAVLAALLGLPVLGAILWFFENTGPTAWIWAWAGVTLFGIVLQYVAPSIIMPLFNKFTPLEEGELRSSIMEYARSVDFPLTGIYVMDGSRRSSRGNAFFTGFGKRKRIALFDTLIDNHTVSELVAVLAHEIGHYKKKHIIVSMLLSVVNMGVVFYLLSLVMNNRALFDAFYMDNVSVYAGFLFFSLLYAPVEFLLSMVFQALSRRHEYQADRYAVRSYSRGLDLVDALKKLSRSNLTNLTPHPFYVFLNYSHPPVLQRISAMRDAVRENRFT